jgi:hypothetical protein
MELLIESGLLPEARLSELLQESNDHRDDGSVN